MIDVATVKEWLGVLLRPDVFPFIVGVVAAIGITEWLKKSPLMMGRMSASTKQARAWYIRTFAFLAGAAITAAMMEGDLFWRVGAGVAAGVASPLVFDIVVWALQKFGIKRASE